MHFFTECWGLLRNGLGSDYLGLNSRVKFNQSLTGKRYIQLIGVHLQLLINFMYHNDKEMFQDDNVPAGTIILVSPDPYCLRLICGAFWTIPTHDLVI